MNIEKIFEAYREGDEGKRLSLFLAYRDLRDIFIRMEQESPHEDFAVIRFPWHRKDRVARAA